MLNKRKYNINSLGSFEEELLIYKNTKEWWYATGILFDNENNMYSISIIYYI